MDDVVKDVNDHWEEGEVGVGAGIQCVFSIFLLVSCQVLLGGVDAY